MKTYFIAGIAAISLSSGVFAQDYDLVILNGRVMDPETGYDNVANVGISGGTITAVTTDNIDGEKVIDASGHVVAPGFIDGHSHVVDVPFGQKLALRDDVTTFLDLEAGLVDAAQWYDYMDGKSQTNYFWKRYHLSWALPTQSPAQS